MCKGFCKICRGRGGGLYLLISMLFPIFAIKLKRTESHNVTVLVSRNNLMTVGLLLIMQCPNKNQMQISIYVYCIMYICTTYVCIV